MEKFVTNALLFNAKPLHPAAFRQYRRSKYVLEHILRSSHLYSGAEHGSATVLCIEKHLRCRGSSLDTRASGGAQPD
jgi:hypothetical protein